MVSHFEQRNNAGGDDLNLLGLILTFRNVKKINKKTERSPTFYLMLLIYIKNLTRFSPLSYLCATTVSLYKPSSCVCVCACVMACTRETVLVRLQKIFIFPAVQTSLSTALDQDFRL